MRVFHIAGSRSTRVVWALEEAGATYELAVITGEERKSDEHRRRHPLGRVPAVELDDGTFMFESAAICMYIADLHPESGLMPTGTGTDRALAYQWTLFAMAELERTLFAWLTARYKEEDETPHIKAFKPVEAALANAISGRTWLVGETFTVPDLLCTGIVAAGLRRDAIDAGGPLAEYVARAEARPAYQRADQAGR
jgi:glutathione S-transferase